MKEDKTRKKEKERKEREELERLPFFLFGAKLSVEKID
jgi:hypothetical protein